MALSADHANLLLSDWVWPTPTTPGYGVLHLFDCKTGERTLTLETTAREPFTHIAVSAKDSIVVGAAEGATQVLDLSKKAVVDNPLAFGASGFRSCAFSEDGTWFARIEYLTGSGQWTEFALMNRKSEKTIKWEERNCRFQQVAFSRDGKLLAAVGFSVKDAVRSPVVVLWHTP
jgi:WD40 repeat protein